MSNKKKTSAEVVEEPVMALETVEEPVEVESTIVVEEPAKEAPAEITEPLVYIGPTILGVAAKGTIYNNGLTKELETAIKDNALIGKFVMKLSESFAAEAELKKTGSALNIFYSMINK